jgi:hypothetical protein
MWQCKGSIRMKNGDVPMQGRMNETVLNCNAGTQWDEESGFANAKEDDQMHCARARFLRERERERERERPT